MVNGRDSTEQDRKLEGGSLEKLPSPVTNVTAPSKQGLHPAVYIVYARLLSQFDDLN